MKRVDIQLNGRTYPVACEDGQEDRVLELAEYVDSKLKAIAASAPADASKDRLLAISALMLADEALRKTESGAEGAGLSTDDEEILLAAVEHLTHRINGLTERLAG